MVFEKLGKSSRSVDEELESKINYLRETHRKYSNVLRLAGDLRGNFCRVVETQKALGEVFSELAQKSPELYEEFLRNSVTQRNLVKSGDMLLRAVDFFVGSVNTLCNKTIGDTLQSVKEYEAGRLMYDAYRNDLEGLGGGDMGVDEMVEEQEEFEARRKEFMKLRSDVAVKLKFLEENRVKVMRKQLLMFQRAVSGYFTGNQSALEGTLKEFNIKWKQSEKSLPSWLEEYP